MSRRALLGIAGWLAAAVAITAVSTWAVSLLGRGITDSSLRPMSGREVDRALRGATAVPTAAPLPSGTSGAARGFSYSSGSVLASCREGRARLLSWTPAPGYGTDDVERGPAAEVTVEFESDDREAKVTVTCRSGVPVAGVHTKDSDDD